MCFCCCWHWHWYRVLQIKSLMIFVFIKNTHYLRNYLKTNVENRRKTLLLLLNSYNVTINLVSTLLLFLVLCNLMFCSSFFCCQLLIKRLIHRVRWPRIVCSFTWFTSCFISKEFFGCCVCVCFFSLCRSFSLIFFWFFLEFRRSLLLALWTDLRLCFGSGYFR